MLAFSDIFCRRYEIKRKKNKKPDILRGEQGDYVLVREFPCGALADYSRVIPLKNMLSWFDISCSRCDEHKKVKFINENFICEECLAKELDKFNPYFVYADMIGRAAGRI